MLHSKIVLNSNVINLLRLYYKNEIEVGGAIFGAKSFNRITIDAISHKQGERDKIVFDMDDKKIFSSPEGMILLGTWHSHIGGYAPVPSIIDLHQWYHWDRKLIHLIISSSCVSFFNYKGRKITYSIESFKGKRL